MQSAVGGTAQTAIDAVACNSSMAAGIPITDITAGTFYVATTSRKTGGTNNQSRKV